MFLWMQNTYEKTVIGLLKEQLEVLKKILAGQSPVIIVPDGLQLVFKNVKGEKMADLVMNLGDNKNAALHYLLQGKDLGAVPASDSPSYSVNDVASISITPNSDGSVTLVDNHNGDTDVDVVLTGSVKGLSVSKTITCKGVAPPPPTPDAVDIVFS